MQHVFELIYLSLVLLCLLMHFKTTVGIIILKIYLAVKFPLKPKKVNVKIYLVVRTWGVHFYDKIQGPSADFNCHFKQIFFILSFFFQIKVSLFPRAITILGQCLKHLTRPYYHPWIVFLACWQFPS